MGLKRRDQNRIYNNYWEIIEKLAKEETSNKSRVSDFIRDYLTLVNNKIPNKSKVYEEFKAKYPTSEIDVLEQNEEERHSVKGKTNWYCPHPIVQVLEQVHHKEMLINCIKYIVIKFYVMSFVGRIYKFIILTTFCIPFWNLFRNG